METVKLYIDDIRSPKTDGNWVILRTSQEAIDYVKKYGVPNFVSLDHDLGGDDTVMIFLKWLIEYDLDNGGSVIPNDFHWNIHSANNVGTDNMNGLLTSYLKQKNL
jgi:peptidoglycan/xylan/chitin deacetylase (PgdA/CDA1 family)